MFVEVQRSSLGPADILAQPNLVFLFMAASSASVITSTRSALRRTPVPQIQDVDRGCGDMLLEINILPCRYPSYLLSSKLTVTIVCPSGMVVG